MNNPEKLGDMELAALVASKICHDAIGPMTAVGFGLDMLEEDDEDEREAALAMIKKGTGTITAKLNFARLAFGAAGSAGASIPLEEVIKVADDYISGDGKHAIAWETGDLSALSKDHVKLLLNLLAIAASLIPRGGTVALAIVDREESPGFSLRSQGDKARIPEGLGELLAGAPRAPVDARSIQPYFTGRVARALGVDLALDMDGADAVLRAG